MRLRDNNAASATCTMIAIVLVGCMVAVFGVAADVEAEVLKFGLIAYLCLAGPLFFASFSGGTASTKHKSFRATPPAYMTGRRVKPRLWWFATVCSSVSIAAMYGAFACIIWAVCSFSFLSARDPWVPIVTFGIPLLAYLLAHVAVAFTSVRLGWLTRSEARELLTKGRRWPETWLEPFDEK